MDYLDYCKLPKLRVVVDSKIEQILRETKVLSVSEINPHNRWRYHVGKRGVPIKYLLKNKKILNEIMKQNPKFSTHGGVYVNLPSKINEDLAYLCGLICGDGNLFVTEKRDYIISIHNKETKLLETSINIFKENFDYSAKIRKGHGCWTVEVRSEVIHSFFNKILEIESGRKENIVIPKKIKSNRKLVLEFIAGFFDAEGSVNLKKNKITCQISIAQKQKKILEEIQQELKSEGINLKFYKNENKTGGCWSLYGNRDSLEPFFEKIPFIHPKKREKLETAVNNKNITKNRKAFSGATNHQATRFCSSTG